MVTEAVSTQGRQRQVGKVHTTITVTNRIDAGIAERGVGPPPRTVTLDSVLVDTGATTLCLPADIVEALGLPTLKEVALATATGTTTARLVQDAQLSILGRSATFHCVVLPKGAPPLLGVIPLEMLGLDLDLKAQVLRLLPEDNEQTYWTAY